MKVTNPISLSHAYRSVRLQEAYLTAIRQPNRLQSFNSSRKISDHRMQSKPMILPTPGINNFFSPKGVSIRTLSIEEINEKRIKGLCYFCNEKYTFGHKCKNSKQFFLLELEQVEGDDNVEEQGKDVQEEGFNQLEMAQPTELWKSLFMH